MRLRCMFEKSNRSRMSRIPGVALQYDDDGCGGGCEVVVVVVVLVVVVVWYWYGY